MTSRRTLSDSAQTTEMLGAELAAELSPGALVLLEGDLAAGKTTLVRGLARGLGADPDEVSSPTFVLVQSYPCAAGEICTLHHVDLYRLEDRLPDLRELGLEELLSDARAVVAVEWPKDAIAAWVPGDAVLWRVRLRVRDDGVREIVVEGP